MLRQWWELLAIEDTIIFINAEILNKEKDCEQIVFVKKCNNKSILLEMAGGEFCGNATRAAMFYLNRSKNISNITIEFVGYSFKIRARCDGNISSIEINIDELVKKIISIEDGITRIDMSGITHFVVEPRSRFFKYNNSKKKTLILIKKLKSIEKAVGVMYLQNFKLKPYVYVENVNTMFFETACGSGTIACALKYKDSNNRIKIKQPSGNYLLVDFIENKLNLFGVCKFIKKDYIFIGDKNEI